MYYKIKIIAIRILPRPVINLLKKIENLARKIRGFYYASKTFNHKRAQIFEFNFGVNYMKKGNFERAYACWELAKQQGMNSAAAYQRISLEPSFFLGEDGFKDFCRKIDGKKYLEIGAATEGILAFMPWINERIIIDPLIQAFRDTQLTLWGKTFLTDDIKLYAQGAEILISELVGKVDGCIICRNTLDHADGPWEIVENIGRYAAKGCILLLWTDLWHLESLDVGHRNITKDPVLLESKIKEIGFNVVRRLPLIRNRATIQYGCVAVKQ